MTQKELKQKVQYSTFICFYMLFVVLFEFPILHSPGDGEYSIERLSHNNSEYFSELGELGESHFCSELEESQLCFACNFLTRSFNKKSDFKVSGILDFGSENAIEVYSIYSCLDNPSYYLLRAPPVL